MITFHIHLCDIVLKFIERTWITVRNILSFVFMRIHLTGSFTTDSRWIAVKYRRTLYITWQIKRQTMAHFERPRNIGELSGICITVITLIMEGKSIKLPFPNGLTLPVSTISVIDLSRCTSCDLTSKPEINNQHFNGAGLHNYALHWNLKINFTLCLVRIQNMAIARQVVILYICPNNISPYVWDGL